MPTSDTTRTAVAGVHCSTPNGGDIRLTGDTPIRIRGGLASRMYGTAIGPLELTAYPSTTATIEELSFETEGGLLSTRGWFDEGSDDTSTSDGGGGGGWFAFLPLLIPGLRGRRSGATESLPDEGVSVSRREMLALFGVLGAGIGAGRVQAAGEKNLTKGRLGLTSNPGGVRVRALDRVENVLPTDSVYHLTVEGIEYDDLAGGLSSYADIPPLVTGNVALGQEVSIFASLKKLSGKKAVSYEDIALPQDPTSANEGSELIITDHDIITTHLQKAGDSDSVLTIGGTSIPHYSEADSDSRGWYDVRDDAVIYHVGSNPPSGETATLTLYVGIASEAKDDVGRLADV